MNIFEAIGLIGGISSISGLLYALHYARKNRKIKLLAYDISTSVPLATVVSPEEDYTLSVIFKRKGKSEEKIESVYVRFLRFANLGKEPIRKIDIAPANPLKINIRDVKTLDISFSCITRNVNNVILNNIDLTDKIASANIDFDYLDYKDGAVIKILTEGAKGTIDLLGDIIGMPNGIKTVDEIQPLDILNKIGCSLAVIIELGALFLSVFAYYWITGSWKNAWLLILPFLALIIPGIIIIFIAATIWPDEKQSLPKTLSLPKWFSLLYYRHVRYEQGITHPEEAEKELTKVKKEVEEKNN